MRENSRETKSRAKFRWLSIALFVLALTLPTLLWIAVGDSQEGVRLEEKRALAKFPSRIWNKVVVELENWYKDHAPYRSAIIAQRASALQPGEKFYREHIHAAASALCAPDWYPSAPFQEGTAYLAPIVKSGVYYGREDWLFYASEGNLDYFQGRNRLTEAEMKEWRSACERLDEICARRGVRLAILVAPNKEQVYAQYMPSCYVSAGMKREEAFLDYMQRNSSTVYLYPLAEMEALKANYPLYYKQDTHWNNLGAYVGAAAVHRALGMPFAPLEEAAVSQTVKTGGDLSNFCGFFSTYPDYEVTYRPEVRVCCESIERTPGATIDHYTSDVGGERKMILIGDSYRTAIAQYFIRDFARTTVLNRIDLESDELMQDWEQMSEGDVLLLVAVERYDRQNMEAVERLAEKFA